MNDWFDYSIPVWHPIAVHVPVVLLPLAAVFAVLWVARSGDRWFGPLSLVLVLATVGTIAAYLSGDAVYQQSEGVPIVEDFVGLHRRLGWFTLIAALASLALTLAAGPINRKLSDSGKSRLRLVAMVFIVVAAAVALATGHLGGIMVWGEYSGS